jgi:hypothetical protein
MTFSYTLANFGVTAQDTIRGLIRDTKSDRPFLQNEEIAGILAMRGLTPTTSAVANRPGMYLACADCCRVIQAKFSSEQEIAVTAVGMLKKDAAKAFAALAEKFENDAQSDAAPQFQDVTTVATADDVHPNGYPNDWVAGVDSIPELE